MPRNCLQIFEVFKNENGISTKNKSKWDQTKQVTKIPMVVYTLIAINPLIIMTRVVKTDA